MPVSETIDSNVHVQDLHISPDGEVTIIGGIDDNGGIVPFSDINDGLIDVVASFDSPPSVKKIKPSPIRKKSNKTSEPRAKNATGGSKRIVKNLMLNVAEEKRLNLSFMEWLASVTERINQTMHYQFNGHPEPLVFHIPQVCC